MQKYCVSNQRLTVKKVVQMFFIHYSSVIDINEPTNISDIQNTNQVMWFVVRRFHKIIFVIYEQLRNRTYKPIILSLRVLSSKL